MKNEQLLNQQIETIAQWIVESKHIVAFTGAGISTDSGIPDFRGPNGVWTRRDAGLPPPRWRVLPGQIEPNASHLSLVELQRLGKLEFLITQNTDNLHRQSGIRPELLAELHGNGQLMRCPGCDRLRARQEGGWGTGRRRGGVRARLRRARGGARQGVVGGTARWGAGYRTQRPVTGQPACADCGGRLVSSVVNFGDPLPETGVVRAAHAGRERDRAVG